MKPCKIDVPVLLIFFCRDKPFSQVFEAVREARPSRLYLYQDGPRSGNQNDAEGCRKCREIAENIDWECKVYKLYQDKNMGCDPSEYIAQKWMFSTEEMGIVLEDDDVPSQSFFPYCKELLERYKDDTRINLICGMNNYDVHEPCKSSYFFSRRGSIWGWASWRRVLDTWDEKYTWMDDPDAVRLLEKNMGLKAAQGFLATCERHRATGRAHYESINGAAFYLQNRINIVPKYNMISNVGIDKTSTHSVSDLQLLPSKTQKLFYKKTYEIEFPLKHPKYVCVDGDYDRQYEESKWRRTWNRCEGLARRIWYGKVKMGKRNKC